jgi:outer membrane protein assembly factor BamD
MIAQSVALLLLATSTQGGVPIDTPMLRAIDQPASRTFEPAAEAEMIAARWYIRTRHDPIGAINRLKIVLWQHRGSTQVEEALALLVQAYLMLGILNEAQSAAATLGRYFPSSSWYAESYGLLKSAGLQPHEEPRSWITRALE